MLPTEAKKTLLLPLQLSANSRIFCEANLIRIRSVDDGKVGGQNELGKEGRWQSPGEEPATRV